MSGLDIISFGCRLNAYESEALRKHARAAGLERAVIVNTCAVTEEAVRQAQQAIRRARREDPLARIVATGCAAQIDPQRFAAMSEIDHVIGNGEKMRAETWAALAIASPAEPPLRSQVGDIMRERATRSPMIAAHSGRTRATVEIQNGCDHRCTFCVIPFGRGPSRSVPAGEVIAQIRRLVGAGHREIVLTGVDITAYGVDLPDGPSLGRLVRRILKEVASLKRLRLSSIDQIEADEDLMAALAEEERLMPHVHLSLQSGDDMILKRMKRRHSGTDAVRFCERARRLRPDIVFGADLIAGFPTETDAMHAASLRHIRECGLTYLHVFPFSSRPGTPAARMPQVDAPTIRARAKALRDAGAAELQDFLKSQVGRVTEVLAETDALARTRQFAEVRLAAPLPPGATAEVRVTGVDGARLAGAPVT